MTTLFVLGNTNEHTFANSIIAANFMSASEFKRPLREIYVLHSPESHRMLTASEKWIQHLALNGITSDIFIHRTIDIGYKNPANAIGKFSRYVEIAVHASEPGEMIVDLTNSTTIYKTLLSTVAYILDIPHLYAIDNSRLGKPPHELGFLDEQDLRNAYVRSPDSTALDAIAHLSMTEVLRYKRIVGAHAQRYSGVNPEAADAEFFSGNLLRSIELKLQGDRSRPRDNALYRIASSSIAASIEDLVRVLMTQLNPKGSGDNNRLMFGQRLRILREHIESSPQPQFDHEFFRRFNDFMLYLRNSTTHKGKLLSDVERFKAELAVKMSFPFLEFYTDIVHPLLAGSKKAVAPEKINILTLSAISTTDTYIVGLDGDDTGAILEDIFLHSNDEKQFRTLSTGVESALKSICKRLKQFNNKNSVIFAAGDDLLFRGNISEQLLQELQNIYKNESHGYTCSIGYGRTFREVYVALKLAKTRTGKNSIVGVELT